MDKTFKQYHQDNPEIYEAFKRITFNLIDKGRQYYGAKGIIEVIRYHTITASKSSAITNDFKINNNYAPDYARKFMDDYPQYFGFFKTRVLKNLRQ